MLDDRKLDVLRAIVEDYVSTNEPVGSKALVERHQLGVSPATIRNDMAALEDEGYITQPHTSAGRMPDGQGLPAVRRPAVVGQAAVAGGAQGHRLVPARRGRPRRRGAPHGAAAGAADPAGRRRAVPVVVAVVGASSRAGAHVRDARAVVLITDTGRVEQRVVDLPGQRIKIGLEQIQCWRSFPANRHQWCLPDCGIPTVPRHRPYPAH